MIKLQVGIRISERTPTQAHACGGIAGDWLSLGIAVLNGYCSLCWLVSPPIKSELHALLCLK